MNRVFTKLLTWDCCATALLLTVANFGTPVFAQGMNYIMPNNAPSPYQNTGYANVQAPYQGTGYPTSNNTPYPNQTYPPQNNPQPYQAPSYPVPGGMQSNQSAGYPAPAGTQPYQPPNYPVSAGTQPYQSQNYPMPSGTQPYQPPNYPPGGMQLYQPPNYPNAANALSPALMEQAGHLTNEAYSFSKNGNNEHAIELLKQALAIDPSLSVAHLDMSLALIALKRYDEALQESSIVLQLDPHNEKGYLNYLAAAIGANHMQDALRVGQEYLNRFPNGENRTTLSNEMVAVAHEVDRRQNVKGIMAPPGAPDNYLYLVTPNGKRRWPPFYMPLKVYINSGQGYKGFSPIYETTLITAFLTWQNASRGMLRFIPVNDVTQANIECRWTDSSANLTLAAEAGDAHVVSDRRTNIIYHVTVTILTCRPDIPSEKLTPTLIKQVCLHEIGHALGLDGHSDSAQDIMYCATDPNVEYVGLSQRDLNTLFLLYQ